MTITALPESVPLSADRTGRWRPLGYAVTAGAVWAILALHLLPTDLMGEALWNEADVLPLARQAADPAWQPNDWYLNQDHGYRFTFDRVAGPLVTRLGFVRAAVVGRAACYAMVAAGLALIGRAIGLRPAALALAVAALLLVHPRQGAAAAEWFVGGFEAKAVAWGLVLLATGLALHGRHLWAALLTGLATSFHVLVGGWMTLALAAWWLTAPGWTSAAARRRVANVAARLALSAVAASGAFGAVWKHLTSPPSDAAADVSPDFLYVFVRLPHHLNAASWSAGAWLRLAGFFAILVLAILSLRRQARRSDGIETDPAGSDAAFSFVRLVLIALLPFALGLLVTPFDAEGRLLKYYLFRLGDVFLPLGAALLTALAVQRADLVARLPWRPSVRAAVIAGLLVVVVMQYRPWPWRAWADRGAGASTPPGGQSGARQWVDACAAVRAIVPPGAVVVTPPAGGADFGWRTGRATVANFKLFPQTPAGIVEWHRRLRDLAPGVDLPAAARRDGYTISDAHRALWAGYRALTRDGAVAVMTRYGAGYLLTSADHVLDLPVLYRNDRFVLYGRAPEGEGKR